MPSPHGLVRIDREPSSDSLVMLHSLTGFLDAGAAGRIAVEHLLATLEHETIAEVDLDALYDYRARRPRMTFLTDHYGDIELPRLVIDEVRDASGQPFLILHGPEPDYRWRAFSEDIVWLAQHWELSLLMGMQAVPWPSPHTRPVNLTAHSNDPELIAGHRAFVGDLEVPAHIAGMLEVALSGNDVPAMGFAAHVPHYLAAAEFPRASAALLEGVATATGLDLPLDALIERAEAAEAEIGLQVAGEEENLEAVRMLEQQYDDFMARMESVEDDLGASDPARFVDEVERFLAERERDERD